jgi:D-lactate dehydrogenase (cytochrome)
MIRKSDPETIAPYLKDASNYSGGCAEEVIIPENAAELIEFLKHNDRPITIAGAGTGVTAGRIPVTGRIISLEKFNKIGRHEQDSICVEAAVSLKQLNEHLADGGWFYPPNPTETLAWIGGTVATNASGSRSYKWGATREFVQSADLVFIDGATLTLSRGVSINEPLQLDNGKTLHFPKVDYVSPKCKNAAGYFIQPEMDWLDLFIGSDGTLAIILQACLRLVPRPSNFVSGVLFFSEEKFCWNLIPTIRDTNKSNIAPCALEYFDFNSLMRLRETYGNIPERARAALFFEQDVYSDDDYDGILQCWFEFLSEQQVSLDDSWFAQNSRDLERFHEFRHRLPVLINEENSRLGRVKIGTDMAVPDAYFLPMMKFYQKHLSASGMDFVMFGHLGDNHLHINLLPEPRQIEEAQRLYSELVDQILKWGGTVSAEHGIGKLKRQYFAQMVGHNSLIQLREIKSMLDPNGLLGQGNLFN